MSNDKYKPERNWAEHDKKIFENPSLEEAEGTGRVHAAYGWSCTPISGWSPEHVEAYRKGYKLYKEAQHPHGSHSPH